MTLAGLVAWLLGAIGLAGAIRLFVRQKADTVAVWRCLGATVRTAFAVHLIQVGTVTLVGGLAGALPGLALEPMLTRLLADFLPVAVTPLTPVTFPFWSLLYAIGLALAVAIWSLLPLRHTPPLRALRTAVEPPPPIGHDPAQAALPGLLVVGLLFYARTHAPTWWVAVAWVGGLIVVLGTRAVAVYATARHSQYSPTGQSNRYLATGTRFWRFPAGRVGV